MLYISLEQGKRFCQTRQLVFQASFGKLGNNRHDVSFHNPQEIQCSILVPVPSLRQGSSEATGGTGVGSRRQWSEASRSALPSILHQLLTYLHCRLSPGKRYCQSHRHHSFNAYSCKHFYLEVLLLALALYSNPLVTFQLVTRFIKL